MPIIKLTNSGIFKTLLSLKSEEGFSFIFFNYFFSSSSFYCQFFKFFCFLFLYLDLWVGSSRRVRQLN